VSACTEILKERGWGALQSLPSTVAAAVLDAQPGMHVLDMCAAPGGKTCAIADSMCNQGMIVAFDRTGDKSLLVRDMARQFGHEGIIHAYKKDSTALIKVSEEVRAKFSSKVWYISFSFVSQGVGRRAYCPLSTVVLHVLVSVHSML
jgi:16S rRNA C967 or C1407 C5-methylase (RsmB/RsmF family)